MIDQTYLSEQLEHLTAPLGRIENSARVLAEPGSEDTLEAILEEIDTTYLTRKLTFKSHDSAVSVIAGGRRVIKLDTVSDDVTLPDGLSDPILSTDNPVAIEGLRAALSCLARDDATLLVESLAYDIVTPGAQVGISSEQLADAWSTPPADETSTHDLRIEAFKDLIAGYLVVDGANVVDASGKQPFIDVLNKAIAADLLTKYKNTSGEAQFLCLQNAIGPDWSIALLNDGEASLVMAYPTKSIDQMMAIWKRVRATV